MKEHKTMVTLAREYLAYRQNLGYVSGGKELLRFARYADQVCHEGPLTTELAVRWATLSRGGNSGGQARRLGTVRQFAQYRSLFDERTEVPPDGLLGSPDKRKPPHIYTDEEIEILLEAAYSLPPRDGLRPHTYTILFGLLVCTGLRISEALSLTRDDVDLDQGVLTVRNTKFGKSRLVPLHPTATAALVRYAQRRDQLLPLSQSRAFFLDSQGLPIKDDAVRKTFQRLRTKLGWTNGAGRRPRIHDLRHSFAVRRLLAWYEEGSEVDQKVAALSTYMGHVKVNNTYWYFSAVPELMAVAASRFERFARKSRPCAGRGVSTQSGAKS